MSTQRRRVAQRFKDAPAMLLSVHRSGGLATASRAGLRRSGATERLTRLYSKFDAAFRSARLSARAVGRLADDAILSPDMNGAHASGLAIACSSPRHHSPGAQ